MTVVLDLITQLATAMDGDEVWRLATAHFRTRGFAMANYGYTRFRDATAIGNPKDAIYLTTCPPDYAQSYFGDGHYARTPAYRWALEHSGLTTWRWVEEDFRAGRLSRDEAAAVETNLALGIRAGLTISFPDPTPRHKGALGLIADPGLDHDSVDAILSHSRAEIEAVAHVMHLRICQLPLPALRRRLSQRQREALEWVAQGKTMQDVATLMKVSPAMVEKHLRLARQALEVETTSQAVAKATLLNLIFPAMPSAEG